MQTMSLLYGPNSIRMLTVNHVNAHYDASSYESFARQLMQVMQDGGRLEVQWDMRPETEGGTPGDRGHITGPELRSALETVQSESGREFSVNTEAEPITDYNYSIEPSRRIGGPVGDHGIESPVPQYRWIFTFGPYPEGGVPVIPTDPNAEDREDDRD